MNRSGTTRNWKNKLLLPLLAGALVWSAAGCSDAPAAAPPERGKLKVAYYSQEAFDDQYGDYFMAKFPELEVEVIATTETMAPGKNPQKEMDKLLDEHKPDLIITGFGEYQRLAAAGKLYELDSFIKQDKFDIENMLPAAIDYLRAKGGGKLYGLAPQFSTSVLYYNKGLFDQYKVPYPTEGMTWDDLFELAGKFRGAKNGKDPIYGFHQPFMMSKFWMVRSMGRDMGLNVMDVKGRTVTIDTEAWQKVFSQMTEAWKNGSIPMIAGKNNKGRWDKEDVDYADLFSQGRAAMTISSPWQIDRLQESGSKIDWQIVKPPSPDGSGSWQPGFYVQPIFAIGTGSGQADKAWKIVRYFNSAEAAKVETKTSNELITRSGFVKMVDGRSMEPFYQVKYDDTLGGGMEFNPNTPTRFYEEFDKQADEQLELIMTGKTTVRQALQQLQKQGQQTLDAAWLAEPQEPEAGGEAAK
ncbi:ABC transporter substrate-binding protein [Paenibacillus tyrfis]|uniref:ABC transporter substrate-binding protein n=1 Tax=Paenibacillus tyrfis TaxID=1501230 RepID=UPI00209CCB8F|nr:extracellular solute-binding protein [Paenibacillus tyrfis]MCP1310560.1 extracellular solute-binding protein [Paenibacillus tyrfis]